MRDRDDDRDDDRYDDDDRPRTRRRRRRDDDDDDRDDRPRIKKRKQGGNTALILIIGGAALVLFLLCAGGGVVGLVLITRDRDRPAVANNNRDAKLDAKGKVLLDQASNLAPNDPVEPLLGGEPNRRMKVFQVNMQPDKTYIVTMDSNEFDAYLRIESPAGQNLAEDDDSGGNLNARIHFRPVQPGMYRIIATAFDGGMGRFRLKVQEAD